MELTKAKPMAEEIKATLAPHCVDGYCEIVGSTRRDMPDVHDLDFVCIPSSQAFYKVMNRLGKCSGGPKIYKVELPIVSQGKPFCVDINIATEATWATLLLIKTGSAEHNKMLCQLALKKGMKLHANGDGLERISSDKHTARAGILEFRPPVDPNTPVPCHTETDIFNALGLKYKSPSDRN